MAKDRIFNLPQTKGTFQVRGHVLGTKNNSFFKEGVTKNGNDFKQINFGVSYDENANIYIDLYSTVRDKVYFFKKDPATNKTETRPVNWSERNNFHEDGYNLIGVNCGLRQQRDENGKVSNIYNNLVEYDAISYMNSYLEDDMSVFVGGNIEYSSFTDSNGNVNNRIKYKPTKIYACKAPIDFEDENFHPQHDFKQTIVFREIVHENEDDKPTGRFIVSAWIVNYGSIENANFIIEDKSLANLFKKGLKEYTAITVWGNISCRAIIEEVSNDDCWGNADPTKRISHPVVKEMIITGADPSTRDSETYTEKEMNKAFEAIRKAKNAEDNFADSKSDDTAGWGTDDPGENDEDSPW